MNANDKTLVCRNNLTSTGVMCVILAVGSLGTVSTLSADVRVGVSLGFELPHGYAEVRVGHDHYYEHRGVFYQHGPRGYVVVRAPRGAFVRALPPHYTRIYVGPAVYYRFGDVYYQPSQDGYIVVDPPVAESLPPLRSVEEYQSAWVGTKEYLFKNGQFFTKTPDGMVWVQAPLGAVTKDPPPDAQSVWYQGSEYFESDNVYFQKTRDGYQVVPMPWKK